VAYKCSQSLLILPVTNNIHEQSKKYLEPMTKMDFRTF
jgi:hypothetical protein